jgi:hypothetical protein
MKLLLTVEWPLGVAWTARTAAVAQDEWAHTIGATNRRDSGMAAFPVIYLRHYIQRTRYCCLLQAAHVRQPLIGMCVFAGYRTTS